MAWTSIRANPRANHTLVHLGLHRGDVRFCGEQAASPEGCSSRRESHGPTKRPEVDAERGDVHVEGCWGRGFHGECVKIREAPMTKPRVYVETTILSYLTALPSRDLVRAAHQQITVEWWVNRDRFSLFVSEAVLEEIRRGDPESAARRMQVADGMGIISATAEAQRLAVELLRSAALPQKAAIDAVHVALAAVHGMDFLLTWNCTHIANAIMRPKIEMVCRNSGFRPPVICTPEELVEQERQ